MTPPAGTVFFSFLGSEIGHLALRPKDENSWEILTLDPAGGIRSTDTFYSDVAAVLEFRKRSGAVAA